MIGGGKVRAFAPDPASTESQAFEGLRGGYFMQELAIDVEECRTIRFGTDDMRFPKFVIEGLAGHKRQSQVRGDREKSTIGMNGVVTARPLKGGQ